MDRSHLSGRIHLNWFYGYGIAKKALIASFLCQMLFALVCLGINKLPYPATWHDVAAYQIVLGSMWRVNLTVLVAFIIAGFVNIKLLSYWQILLGKLVINDLKATVDRCCSGGKRIFMVFDEFSVFAGEQVLNLVNMGRGKGVHAVFGTQGLADLEKVDPTFKAQVLNCVNTLICHRLNDQDSADTIASWIGTKEAFTVSAQFNPNQSDAGVGAVAHTREYIVPLML